MRVETGRIAIDRKHDNRYLVVTSLDDISAAIGARVNIIYTNCMDPGAVAGNHYHNDKRECFRVVEGEVVVVFVHVETKHRVEMRLSSNPEDEGFMMVVVPPGVAHAVINVGGRPAKFDVYANNPPRIEADDFAYEAVSPKDAERIIARYARPTS